MEASIDDMLETTSMEKRTTKAKCHNGILKEELYESRKGFKIVIKKTFFAKPPLWIEQGFSDLSGTGMGAGPLL